VARLSDEAYKLTIGEPMTVLTPADLDRPIALGEYVDAIEPGDLDGHDFGERAIDNVYRDPSERFIHVSFRSKTPEVFLVVVVEGPADSVYGHHLLDLRRRGRFSRLVNRR
jgi:hypothetical protein